MSSRITVGARPVSRNCQQFVTADNTGTDWNFAATQQLRALPRLPGASNAHPDRFQDGSQESKKN